MIIFFNNQFRLDFEDYFKLSGIRECEELPHHPFLVFQEEGRETSLNIVHKPAELITFPDENIVIAQWEGKYRSDWFKFKVNDFKNYIKKYPKKEYYVI